MARVMYVSSLCIATNPQLNVITINVEKSKYKSMHITITIKYKLAYYNINCIKLKYLITPFRIYTKY